MWKSKRAAVPLWCVAVVIPQGIQAASTASRRVGILQLARPKEGTSAHTAVSLVDTAIVELLRASHTPPDIVAVPAGFMTELDVDPEALYCGVAAQHNVAVAGTYTNNNQTTTVLCTRLGKSILTYAKRRGTRDEPTAGAPQSAILPLEDGGSIRVGLLLDTDAYFMEPARVLMIQGTQLVLLALDAPLMSGDRRYLFWAQRDNGFDFVAVNYAEHGGSSAFPTSALTAKPCYYSEAQGNQKTTLEMLDPCLELPAGPNSTVYTTSQIAALADTPGAAAWGDPESSRKPFDYQPMCYRDEADRAAQRVGPKELLPPGTPRQSHQRENGTIVVALLQYAAATGSDPLSASAIVAESKIREAVSGAAVDVVLLPEQWSVGYMANANFSTYSGRDSTAVAYKGYMSWATTLDGPYVTKFRSLARELGVAIALPFVQEVKDGEGAPVPPRNSVTLIDRFGRIVYTYSKVHIAFGGSNGGDVEGFNSAGRGFYSGELDVDGLGNVTACSFICYDREHPESARGCRAAGAELVLVPTACGVDYAAVDLVAVRAGTNAMAIAMANFGTAKNHTAQPRRRGGAGSYYCGGLDCNGMSMGADHLGNVVFSAPGDPGTLPTPNPDRPAGAQGTWRVPFNISALREYRNSPRGRALVAERLMPELCRIPTATAHSAPTCNAHRMWL